jgi:hypothetical protein
MILLPLREKVSGEGPTHRGSITLKVEDHGSHGFHG